MYCGTETESITTISLLHSLGGEGKFKVDEIVMILC